MTRRADKQNPTFFTGEALVAQLQSVNDQTGILEQTVPGTNVTWGTIMGNIEDQTDLVQFVNDLIQKALTGEIEVDLSKYALKTDLENLATKDEIPVVPTNVSAFFNDIGYLTEHQDISNLATKDEFKALEDKAVTYKDFEYQGQTRKTIELANYNTLSGLGTDGSGYNLAMISKWDVADFGSPGVHMNLNTKDTVTINDDQVVATTKNIEDAIAGIDVSTYATKEELNAKADKTELEAYALKADAVTHGELADYPTKEEMDIAVNAKANTTDVEALKAKVEEVKAVADNAVPYSLYDNRKFIQMANHDSLSGVMTNGDAGNLIMMSKWDKVDIGTSKVVCNLNAKDGVVTINDDKQIATQQDVTDAVAAIDLTPYALKAEADKDYAKAETLLPGIVTDVFGQIIYNPYNVQVAYNKAIKHGTAGDEIEYVEEPAERHNFVIDGATAEKAGVLAAADKAKLDALNIDLLATKEEVAEKANASEVYTKTEVDAKIASVYVYKGSVATQAELPQENNKVGDTYNVTDTGHNYTWDGTQWDDLGGTVDLSAYATTEALNAGLAAKANTEHTHAITEVIDLQSVLDGKQPVGNYPVYTNYGTVEEPRLSVELKNHDSISGLDTTGLGHNLAMVSQWDVADFGATGLHMNLNTKNNVTINDDKVVATIDDVEEVKKLTPVMVQIPIRTKSTFNTVQDKETILGWFGCTQDSELKGLISRQQPMFLKYGISLSTNPHYYKMPIQYIAYESANQVKIVTIGLDTNNDVVSKYEILMNLDGTVIENGGNVKMTITALENAETIATLQETIAQLTSRIEALEQA